MIHLDMLTEAKFFYNAWDGKQWHKKLMREGESVVLLYEDFENLCDTAATPYVTSANTNHEWRVFVNPQTGLDELIDTVEALKREMSKEFKEIWEHISGLTERVDILSGFVGDMYDEMQSGFSSAFTAISDLQDELDVVEASVGLSGDGTFIVIRESGITSGATTIAEAIGILDDVILEDEEIVAASLNDLNRRMINLSGVVEEMKDQQDQMQEEIDNIENGVGLDEDGNHIPNDGNYTSSAETVEEEISALDDALKEVSDEVEELKKKTIEPLDASIVVEVSGYTTYVGVQLDPEDEHIKLGDNGLWFDGDFGEATPDEYMPEGN
jgi:predicted RNase H-like nuclease (RuvC/YqgF family)